MTACGTSEFTKLPEEDVLYGNIFVFLSLKDLFCLKVVCKTFDEIVTNFLNSPFCTTFDLSIIGSGKLFNGDVFKRMIQNKHNLLKIDFTSCKHWLKDEHLRLTVLQNAKLKKVVISSCYNISNEVFLDFGNKLNSVRVLDVSHCKSLTKETLVFIGNNIKTLVSIDISGCWGANDDCVEAIALNNKELKEFHSSSCYSLTDISISTLAKSCSKLQEIDISGCWRVTNQSVFIIREYCKNLKKLYVKDCRSINEISIASLRPRGIIIDIPAPRKYLQSSSARSLLLQT
ncbi:F-box/LRR-repeat protein 15-like [Clytia hemisphaerica]|uniref:F-box/LRR-repeat protein 15-like leucin rich repeat domain-containing protein n=1 Tax=Clytia hemisphaerica TaxID=252671 RepID=A0A7M5UIV0_9CNID